jgi:hypothetical protein
LVGQKILMPAGCNGQILQYYFPLIPNIIDVGADPGDAWRTRRDPITQSARFVRSWGFDGSQGKRQRRVACEHFGAEIQTWNPRRLSADKLPVGAGLPEAPDGYRSVISGI